jgi:hypothetical protein
MTIAATTVDFLVRWCPDKRQVAGPTFNAAQLAVIGADGQLPKLDLAYLLRFYAQFHVGIPVTLQVLRQC